jgi:hypothetical protein
MSLGPGSRITHVLAVELARPRELSDPRAATLYKRVEALLA